jgi:hypothetical protein
MTPKSRDPDEESRMGNGVRRFIAPNQRPDPVDGMR